MFGTATAAVIGGALGAGGSILGGQMAARGARDAARTQARGIDRGIEESAGHYTEAQNFLSPFATSGQRYGSLMDDIMGLNGPEAQARARQMYESNPSAALLGNVRDETFRRGMNTWAAAGGGNSGRAMEDMTRRMSDVTLNDYYRWQDAGQGMYRIGATAAGPAASIAAGRGRDILGARTGQGTALASGAAASGLYTAAGMTGAGNYLGNMLGRTDFSKMFNTGAPGGTNFTQPAQPPPGYYTNPLFSTVPYGGF